MNALQILKNELKKTSVISQEFKTFLLSLATEIYLEAKEEGKKETKK